MGAFVGDEEGADVGHDVGAFVGDDEGHGVGHKVVDGTTSQLSGGMYSVCWLDGHFVVTALGSLHFSLGIAVGGGFFCVL